MVLALRSTIELRVSAPSITTAAHVHPMPRLSSLGSLRSPNPSSAVMAEDSGWHWLRFWLPSPRHRSWMRLRGRTPKHLVRTRPSLPMTNPLRVRPSLHATRLDRTVGRTSPLRLVRPRLPHRRMLQREPAPLRASRPASPRLPRLRLLRSRRCSHCAPVLVMPQPTADRARRRPTLPLPQTMEPRQVPHATPARLGLRAMLAAERRRSRSTTSWSRASSKSLLRTTFCAEVSSSTTGRASMRDSHLWCLSRSKILCSNPSLGLLVRGLAGNSPLAFIRLAQTPGDTGPMRVEFFGPDGPRRELHHSAASTGRSPRARTLAKTVLRKAPYDAASTTKPGNDVPPGDKGIGGNGPASEEDEKGHG